MRKTVAMVEEELRWERTYHDKTKKEIEQLKDQLQRNGDVTRVELTRAVATIVDAAAHLITSQNDREKRR